MRKFGEKSCEPVCIALYIQDLYQFGLSLIPNVVASTTRTKITYNPIR